MKNVIYNICSRLRGSAWATETFEVLRAECYKNNTCKVVARLENDDIENQLTKDIIYNICSRMKGFTGDTETFEVLKVELIRDNNYLIVVKLVNTEAGNEEVANDDSNQ